MLTQQCSRLCRFCNVYVFKSRNVTYLQVCLSDTNVMRFLLLMKEKENAQSEDKQFAWVELVVILRDVFAMF